MKVNWAEAIARYDSSSATPRGGQTFGAWFPQREADPEIADDLNSLRAKIAELEAQIAATAVLPPAAPNPVWRAMRFGPLNPMRIGLIARLP